MNYFASDEIFYRLFFLPTKFNADFFSTDEVSEGYQIFNLKIYIYSCYPKKLIECCVFECKTRTFHGDFVNMQFVDNTFGYFLIS